MLLYYNNHLLFLTYLRNIYTEKHQRYRRRRRRRFRRCTCP